MFKISFKIVLLFISVSLMRLSLEYLIGSSKPYYCISACDSSFERGLHAFMPFVVGSFILWLTIRDFDRGDQLIQKGKYCYKKTNFKEPYCCKCYKENGALSKLKKIDGKYLCRYCDYAEIYVIKNDIKDISVRKILDNIKKL